MKISKLKTEQVNKKLDFNDLSREALNEMLEAVEHCISYRKKDHEQWADSTFPGCLGIPAAILLFSIADAMGSYHRGTNKKFVVEIDGATQALDNKAKHLYILIPHGVRICAKRYKKRVSKVRFESTKT